MLKISSILATVLVTLPIICMPIYADEVPAAMKIPVNPETTPADTTSRTLDAAPNSDNTSRNKIHDGKSAVSADQQGNSKADVETTRKIRQALIKDKGLSVYAHNVKIITNDGRVVLKGPVNSNEEKLKIEEQAFQVAGREKVLSEIEVK